MLATLKRLLSSRRQPTRPPSLHDWVFNTIRTSDTVVNTLGPSQSMELVRRATQWVMICADRNASVCSQIPLRLYTTRGGRGTKSLDRRLRVKRLIAKAGRPVEDVYEIERHEVLDVLQNPNPYMSGMQSGYFRYLSREITGNAYFHCPDRGVMLPMWPQWTRIIGDKSDMVSGYTYGNGETGTTFPADEVFHSKFVPSLFSPLYGCGPLAWVFREADIGLYCIEAETSRWKNEGRPPYAIEIPPGTDPDQRKQIMADVERQIRGVRNAGRGIALALAKLTPLGWSPKEMEYREGRAAVIADIWAAYAIPESVLKPNEGSLAAAAVGYPGWMRSSIIPRCKRDADDLTGQMLPRYGLDPAECWLEYDPPSEHEEATIADRQIKLVGAGLRTLDEVRSESGYEAYPGGVGAVPRINGIVVALAEEPEEPDLEGDDAEDVPAESDAGGDGPEGTEEGTEDGRVGMPRGELPESKSLILVRKDLRASLESILSNIIGSIDETGALRADWEAFKSRLVSSLTADYIRGALKALQEVGRPDLESTWEDVVPTAAVTAVNQHGGLLIEQIKGTTNNDIREAVARGLTEGRTIADIRNDLMQSGYAANRAETIARTETAWALESGRSVAMKQAGMKSKEWLLAGEPCPMCEGFRQYTEGKVVSLDQSFALAGETWAGTDGKSYTADRDIKHGPLHPNCRCTASYSMEAAKP